MTMQDEEKNVDNESAEVTTPEAAEGIVGEL